jgi:DNA mismatch repair ATPase MutS
MQIDAKTLRDLEIFHSRDGGPSVFELLDRTKTNGGRAALRRRFENPLAEVQRIRDVQEAVRFLQNHDIEHSIDPALVERVTRYLASSWEAGSRMRGALLFIDSLWVSLRYRDFVQFARRGAQATRTLVGRADDLARQIHGSEPPTEIAHLVDQVMELTVRLKQQLHKVRRAPWALLKRDGELRLHHRADLREFLRVLSELEALWAMASATRESGLTIPEVADTGEFLLQGEGVFHLFLSDPTSNPVSVAGDEPLVFLTGPNMSGKTTYLKSVGVATFLAHLGMGVPAASWRFAPLHALLTSLSPEENLRAGVSYFLAEVERVREVAQVLARRRRALVLFDEIFKGTNLQDAQEASKLVILGFSKSRTSGFIISSHLIELADDLQGQPSIQFQHFEGDVRDGKAVYEFHLKPGVSDQRLGFHLLHQQGVPKLLADLE